MVEWRPVVGWPNYRVSETGVIENIGRGSEVATFENKQGKLRVNLWSDNKTKQVYLHRILAEAFIPNELNLPIVRHLDDNPKNNRLSNLAWGTARDNAEDMIRNGNHSGINQVACKYGHPYDEVNTYIDKKGGRRCRTCNRERARQSKEVT